MYLASAGLYIARRARVNQILTSIVTFDTFQGLKYVAYADKALSDIVKLPNFNSCISKSPASNHELISSSPSTRT